MKKILQITYISVCLLAGCQAPKAEEVQKLSMEKGTEEMEYILVEIDGQTFQMNLYENEATKVFLEQLPMQVQMDDLHTNEKYMYTDTTFPTDQKTVKEIHTGDFMLYGNNCLVLFYETFNTSFAYTKLGYIDDITGFKEKLTQGSVQVKFALPHNE